MQDFPAPQNTIVLWMASSKYFYLPPMLLKQKSGGDEDIVISADSNSIQANELARIIRAVLARH